MNRPVYTSPIIFSGPMIRSLLNGSKTQTRRLITSQWANVMMHHGAGERVLLWVREGWQPIERPTDPRSEQGIPLNTWQVGDGRWLLYRESGESWPGKWKPSIHMPRWASRLTLELSDVRIQRLQDISEGDARAEGCGQYTSQTVLHWPFNPHDKGSHRAGYRELWASLHDADSWDANPEVVVLLFAVNKGTIDKITGGV